MPLASVAMPPVAYMNFCRRKPLDCGESAQLVRAGVALVESKHAELEQRFGADNLPAVLVPASIDTSSLSGTLGAKAPAPGAKTASGAASMAAESAVTALAAELISDESQTPREPAPVMTPALWSMLNQINGQVNGAIHQQSDLRTYGLFDYWNTPLEDGIKVGDCEDFVLEKQRALISAGLPRSALNIAVVRTSWGELHAVLLVSTNEGEYVLDSLTSGISAWRDAPYEWIRREVNGDPFHWATVAVTPEPPRDDGPFHKLLIAMGR